MWTVFWIGLAALLIFEFIGIFISVLTQYRQAESAEKYWKSLHHIHNPKA